MAKHFASIIGATTLALATALSLATFVGCSDTTTGPTETVQSSDPYAYFKVDETDLTDFSEIPTYDQVFSASILTPTKDPFINPDSTHKGRDTADHPKDSLGGGGRKDGGRDPKDSLGGPGRKDSLGGGGQKDGGRNPKDSLGGGGRKDTVGDHGKKDPTGGRDRKDSVGRHDFGRLNYGSYDRVIKQLKLSAEQDSLVRLCFKDYRECASAAAARYGAARRALADSMRATIAAIRAQVDAGTITKDQARPLIDAAVQNYRAQAGPLAEDYRTATEACRMAFNGCVRSILTADQLVIWDSLVK